MRKANLVCSLEKIVEKRWVHKDDLGPSVRDLESNFFDGICWIGSTEYTSTSGNAQVRDWTEYMVRGKHHDYFTLADFEIVQTQTESLDPTQGLFR